MEAEVSAVKAELEAERALNESSKKDVHEKQELWDQEKLVLEHAHKLQLKNVENKWRDEMEARVKELTHKLQEEEQEKEDVRAKLRKEINGLEEEKKAKVKQVYGTTNLNS